MTTPTNQPTPQADRITAAEIRELFKGVHVEITEIRDEISALTAELEHMREGLTHASQPAPVTGITDTFLADVITFATDENGKQAYKIRGGKFSKNGVRVWPEVLPLLGIDETTLTAGKNPIDPPIMVRVEIAKRPGKSDLGENPEMKYDYARKVIGKA